MYAYNYTGSNFAGLTISWDYQNKIKIYYDAVAGDYKFKCFPFFQNSNASYETATSSLISLGATLNKWIFIICAVDFDNLSYYLTTDTLAPQTFTYASTVTRPTTPIRDPAVFNSTLRFSDDSVIDYGVLFLSQIRFWKDSYANAGFLARVSIQTKSLFSTLISLFDPLFIRANGTAQILSEIVTPPAASNNVNLTYSTTIGVNVLDDSLYAKLNLCSEDGQYYEAISDSCISKYYYLMNN